MDAHPAVSAPGNINIRYLFIADRVKSGEAVPASPNRRALADYLTKPLQ
jgi:hypothetical protein